MRKIKVQISLLSHCLLCEDCGGLQFKSPPFITETIKLLNKKNLEIYVENISKAKWYMLHVKLNQNRN